MCSQATKGMYGGQARAAFSEKRWCLICILLSFAARKLDAWSYPGVVALQRPPAWLPDHRDRSVSSLFRITPIAFQPGVQSAVVEKSGLPPITTACRSPELSTASRLQTNMKLSPRNVDAVNRESGMPSAFGEEMPAPPSVFSRRTGIAHSKN